MRRSKEKTMYVSTFFLLFAYEEQTDSSDDESEDSAAYGRLEKEDCSSEAEEAERVL